jgi:hypothetical protein
MALFLPNFIARKKATYLHKALAISATESYHINPKSGDETIHRFRRLHRFNELQVNPYLWARKVHCS